MKTFAIWFGIALFMWDCFVLGRCLCLRRAPAASWHAARALILFAIVILLAFP